jgi:hypothetical protein
MNGSWTMSNWLEHETTIMGVDQHDCWLWTEVRGSFLQFRDTMEAEQAQMMLKTGVCEWPIRT